MKPCWVAALAFALTFGMAPSSAEDQLKLELRVGLGQRVTGYGFAPVFVTVTSLDGLPRTATLKLWDEGGLRPILELGQVALAGTLPHLVRGLVPAHLVVEGGELLLTAETGEGQRVGHTTLLPDTVPHPLLVILDRRGAAPADLSPLELNPPHWVSVVLPGQRELPESMLGYTNATAVLLGEFDLAQWSPAQSRALATWVERGGNLIVSLGDRAQALRRSLLGRHLGVGLAPLPDRPPRYDVPLAEFMSVLADTYGESPPEDLTHTPHLSDLLPLPQDLVLLEHRPGQPFLLQHRHGQGIITFVAADLWSRPFLHTPLTARLLESILSKSAGSYSPRANLLFRELASVRQPARTGPAFAVLILFALLAGPGCYFLLRARRRAILVWAAIPLLTLVFTLFVPFYRLALQEGESTLVGVRLLECMPAQATARETTDFVLFSGSYTKKRVEYQGRDVTAFGMFPPRRLNRGLPRPGQVLSKGGDEVSFEVPISLWGERYISIESGAESPGLSGKLLFNANLEADRVELHHDGSIPLENGLVVYSSRSGPVVHSLDEILRPGTLRTLKPSPLPIGAYVPGPDLDEVMLDKTLKGYCMQLLGDGPGHAYLLGTLPSPPPLRASPNVNVRSFATVVVVPLTIDYRGGIPFGIASRDQSATTVAELSSNTVMREVTSRFLFPHDGATAPAAVKLKVLIPVHRVSDLHLEVRSAGTDTWTELPRAGLHASRSDREGRVRFLLRFPSPAPQNLPDPGDWFDQQGDQTLLQLRQTFVRARGARDEPYVAQIEVALELADAGWSGDE